jgi:hypothetical protein
VENKQAVIDAKCKLFLLTDTNSLPEEWASAIILGREKISSVVRKNEGPFFATISKRSDTHVTNARFPVPREVPAEAPVVNEPAAAEIAVPAVQGVMVQPEEPQRLFPDEPEENNEL